MSIVIEFLDEHFLLFVIGTYLLIGFIQSLIFVRQAKEKFYWSYIFLWPFLNLDLESKKTKGQFTFREKVGWFLVFLVMAGAILFAKHQHDSGIYKGTRWGSHQ